MNPETQTQNGGPPGAFTRDGGKPQAAQAEELILKKNFSNIVEKLKAGKTLTRHEQEIVAQHTAGAMTAASADEILTQDEAHGLLRRDVSNLIRKVQSGKTLSAGERALVQAAAAGGDPAAAKAWAGDQVELADALGVTRKTVQRWRKEAGAPAAESDGRWNVTAWRAWMKTTGKKGGEPEDAGPSKSQLEARRLLLMNEKLETEVGILKREYTLNSDTEQRIRSMVVEARKTGEQMPAALAPQLAGLTVPEIERRLRAWWDEFCLALHTGRGAAVRARND